MVKTGQTIKWKMGESHGSFVDQRIDAIIVDSEKFAYGNWKDKLVVSFHPDSKYWFVAEGHGKNFNYGYHDGALDARNERANKWAGKDHPSRAYKLGYLDGYSDQAAGVYDGSCTKALVVFLDQLKKEDVI